MSTRQQTALVWANTTLSLADWLLREIPGAVPDRQHAVHAVVFCLNGLIREFPGIEPEVAMQKAQEGFLLAQAADERRNARVIH